MVELTVVLVIVLGGAAVAVAVKPSDSSNASSPLCRDTNRCFLPRQFIPFIPFLPSPSLSLSVSQSISPVFVFLSFDRFSLNTIGFSLSQFPSYFSSFPLPFFSPGLGGIYRGRGSKVDPAPSHRCPCMVRTLPTLPRCRQRWPMEVSLAGHGCSSISS